MKSRVLQKYVGPITENEVLCCSNFILIFFKKDCGKLFSGWTQEAYNKVIEKNNALQPIQTKNKELKNEKQASMEKYDKLNKDILLTEKEFDFLLRIQVNIVNS